MENRFKILSYSKIRMALLMIFSCIVALLLTVLGGELLGEVGFNIAGGVSILIGLLNTFITPKYLAKSELEIYCDTTFVEITCTKPRFGNRITKIISIKYDELKSYKFEGTNYFSTFKLVLKDGTIYKFHRWYNDNDDQFDKFFTLFKRNIKIYDNKKNSSERIRNEKSILENRFFLIVVAIILLLLFLTSVILLFTRGIQNKSGISYIFIVLPSLIWLSFQVIQGLKK
ncbi:MAG: hypothetical protein MUC81_11920 [Bacteroidia bacterium]|jgi:hypothetical protein|nr:hypothetical protein [Bacteroidia bacterium]